MSDEREQPYRVPTDASGFVAQPPFEARSVQIVNASTQTVTYTNDAADAVGVPSGEVVTLPLPPSTSHTLKCAAPATGAVWAFFFDVRKPAAGSLLPAGSGGNPTSTPQPTGAAHHASSVITLPAGLTARATRTAFVLQAPAANAADVVLTGGVHIAPGGSFSGTAIDAIAFTGTAGDTLNAYEEYN